MVWSADATHNPKQGDRSAEHAHAVDAAARPRDPRFFEGQNRLKRDPDLWVAAHLMGRPLGRTRSKLHCGESLHYSFRKPIIDSHTVEFCGFASLKQRTYAHVS